VPKKIDRGTRYTLIENKMSLGWDSIKKKLGYGSLEEEEKELSLIGAVKSKSRFDAVVNEVVTALLAELIAPWIEHCFNMYSEQYFHQKMNEGFDFIKDWKTNHPARYSVILRAIRKVRGRIILDEQKILQVVLAEMRKKDWTVTEPEKARFIENIRVLIQEIYS
jgi:hypothetical protein